MISLICDLIAKIVQTGINGTIYIPILVFLIWYLVGQTREAIAMAKEILSEGRVK